MRTIATACGTAGTARAKSPSCAKSPTPTSPPFISQGIFDNGELHGAWIVYDAKGHKVSEIRFNRGEREGVATWWHANGKVMRKMKFEEGVINGLLQECAPAERPL